MQKRPNSTQLLIRKGISKASRIIKASRKAVYDAFIDPKSVAVWLAPDNMRGEVHDWDVREGGTFRMTLTYLDPAQSPGGKTTKDQDSFRGRFAEIIPYEEIVEIIEFESKDPRMKGEMEMTVSLADTKGGTEVTLLFQDIPPGIRPEDNDKGSRQSLRKLARLLETA